MIYELSLSNGTKLPITEKDLQKIRNNISEKFIEVETGIINPSFIVSISIDLEATKKENLELSKQVKDINFPEIDFVKNKLLSENVYDIKKINSLLSNKPAIYENRK